MKTIITDCTPNEFGNICHNLSCAADTVTNNEIKFLDIPIYIETVNIYHIPTAANTLIHNTSFHSPEHKISALKYMVNGINAYPMSDTNKIKRA
jgi:hypothetical protein